MSEEAKVGLDPMIFQEGSRFLSFSLGVEQFAIPLLKVKQVIAVPEFTPIPHSPAYFEGIMNIRGQIISVIDLRKKLAIKPGDTEEEAIIICDLDPLCIGIIVDSVNSVLSPTSEDMAPKPSVETKIKTDYIESVYRKEKNIVLFLNIAKALNAEDLIALERAKQVA